MDYETLLMIGGPGDGRTIDVLKAADQISVPMNCLGEMDAALMECGKTIYVKRQTVDLDGTRVTVLLASGVTNPIQRLIAGYKP